MELNKKITVLIPVYNGEKYLKEAITSILYQTYEDFDLLVINDGSTDKSENVILSFTDERIKYIKNEKNIGLIKTLNKGLDLISGEYVVRMDQDDISLPNRLEKQIKFMDENKEIVVSGTNIRIFGDNIKTFVNKLPMNPSEIKVMLLFENCIMHPTVIMRKEVLDIEKYRYNIEHIAAEDFGLWQLISQKYSLSNIDEVLLEYRVSESSMTQQAEKIELERDKILIKIYKQALNELNLEEKDFFILRKLLKSKQLMEVFEIEKIISLKEKIVEKIARGKCIENFLNKYIAKKILDTLKYDILKDNDTMLIRKKLEITKNLCIFGLNSKYWILQNLQFFYIRKFLKLYFSSKLRRLS
ncbi:MAG: glycosyltransferase [Fusobacteriaceae bacterium]|nr:glycosyltransferase [Fusobacteriaceae bacterium]